MLSQVIPASRRGKNKIWNKKQKCPSLSWQKSNPGRVCRRTHVENHKFQEKKSPSLFWQILNLHGLCWCFFIYATRPELLLPDSACAVLSISALSIDLTYHNTMISVCLEVFFYNLSGFCYPVRFCYLSDSAS